MIPTTIWLKNWIGSNISFHSRDVSLKIQWYYRYYLKCDIHVITFVVWTEIRYNLHTSWYWYFRKWYLFENIYGILYLDSWLRIWMSNVWHLRHWFRFRLMNEITTQRIRLFNRLHAYLLVGHKHVLVVHWYFSLTEQGISRYDIDLALHLFFLTVE